MSAKRLIMKLEEAMCPRAVCRDKRCLAIQSALKFLRARFKV